MNILEDNKDRFEINQTYFSDGTRKVTITYKSFEGDRAIYNKIKELLAKEMGISDVQSNNK